MTVCTYKDTKESRITQHQPAHVLSALVRLLLQQDGVGKNFAAKSDGFRPRALWRPFQLITSTVCLETLPSSLNLYSEMPSSLTLPPVTPPISLGLHCTLQRTAMVLSSLCHILCISTCNHSAACQSQPPGETCRKGQHEGVYTSAKLHNIDCDIRLGIVQTPLAIGTSMA